MFTNNQKIKELLSEIKNVEELKIFTQKIQDRKKILERKKKDEFITQIKKIYDEIEFKYNFHEFILSCIPKIKARYGKRKNTYLYDKIRYKNPYDETQTWTGVGFKPNWLKEGIEQNKFTLEQCKISN